MDRPGRSRRQSDQQVHQASNPRYPPQPSPVQSAPSGAAERYRPAPPNLAPSTTPRSMGVAGNYNTYYHQQPPTEFSGANMSSTILAYGGEYGADSRTQTPVFGNYNAGMMMYNMAQPGTQPPAYDTQQFAPRQHAGMQIMPPSVSSTYFGSDAGGTATSPLQASLPSQGHTSGNAYPPQHPGIGYAGSVSNMGEMQHSSVGSTSGVAETGNFVVDDAMAEKWANYQRQLSVVFQNVAGGQLESAADVLLSISNWLLSQVAELGLHQDDASLHDDRIKMWNDFNHAWLALGYRQKELTSAGAQPQPSHKPMGEETIKKLGDELIRLCDGVERHGLVDYEYGVWEEQIEAVLEQCLDICEASTR